MRVTTYCSTRIGGRPADADNRGRRFETDRVGRELRHAARHIRRDAAHEVQHHAETAFARRVDVALEPDLAARADRQTRVVPQRDADGSVRTGPQRVAREDRVSGPRRDGRVLPHDERRSGRHL